MKLSINLKELEHLIAQENQEDPILEIFNQKLKYLIEIGVEIFHLDNVEVQ